MEEMGLLKAQMPLWLGMCQIEGSWDFRKVVNQGCTGSAALDFKSYRLCSQSGPLFHCGGVEMEERVGAERKKKSSDFRGMLVLVSFLYP